MNPPLFGGINGGTLHCSNWRYPQMALSDVTLRKAKPQDKPYKLTDEKGLFLLVNTKGGKYWRLKYRFEGKEKLLALGTYPALSLMEARNKREEARRLLADNTDPALVKHLAKRSNLEAAENSFKLIACEWHAKYSKSWSPGHADRIFTRLENDIFPWVGNKPISKIGAYELLTVLQRIENRGAVDTAHRALQNCSQIFRYAVATGRAEQDPTINLRGAIPPAKQKHYPTIIDPKEIADLLRTIDGYEGHFITRCALRLAPLLFVRPGELRNAQWSEINFDNAEWRIPAKKMKMRIPHIIPLSAQALSILREVHALTGNRVYVFTGIRGSDRPMSDATVNAALRRLGYAKDEITGHSFRSIASTILNEQGWNRDAIERQLAHSEQNNVRAAYNYAEHLPLRKKMMQYWSDYLQSLVTNKPAPKSEAINDTSYFQNSKLI